MPTEKKYTLICGPGRTKTSFLDSCDINHIMARALKTGSINMSTREGHFADLSKLPDFKTAMEIVIQGQGYFNALPASLRDRFNNDPARLLDFLADKKNLDEAVKLGLVTEIKPPEDPKAKPAGTEGATGA